MIRLPDSSAVGPTPNANSGRPIASVDLTGVGKGMQQLGGGLQQAGGDVMQSARLANLEQRRADLFQTSTNADADRAATQAAYDEFKNSAPADGKNYTNNWLGILEKRQQDFAQTVSPEMRPRIEALQKVEREQWGRTASNDQRAIGGKYVSGVIQSDYENYQKSINLDPNSRDTAQKALFAKIDVAPYLDAATKADMKQKAQNGIEVAQWKALYGTDPTGGERAFGRRSSVAPTTPDGVWQNMLHAENAAGDSGAVSSKGAQGAAQVMPATARTVASQIGMPDVATMSDSQLQSYFTAHPEVNEKIGRAYFDQQMSKYKDPQAAVIAYNAGPSVAEKWLASGRDDSVLPEETKGYKAKVLGADNQSQSEEESPDTLVDASSTIPHDATPDTVGLTKFLVAGKGSETVTGMQKPLQQGLSAMFAAAPADVQPYLKIFSGYRSPERQAQLYAAALQKYGSPEAARKWVAPPGKSEHNKGFAADLAFDGAGTTAKLSPAGQAAMQWAHANASKFGLVFPLGNEPWHVEAAGARSGAAGSQIAGGTPDPRFSSITLDQQESLLRQAEAGAAIYRGQVTSQVRDDLASMEQTGQGLSSLSADRVKSALGDDAANAWMRQRQLAQTFHDSTADFASLPDDLIQKRVAGLAPVPGQDGFVDAQHSYGKAAQAAEAVIQQRQTDPAAAVSSDHDVQKASNTASMRSPASYQDLVNARIAAQTKIGIPQAMQSPMTWQESQTLLAPLIKALPGQQKEALQQVVQQVSSLYGNHADAAMAYMMGQYKADAAQKAIVGSILRKVGLGQPITRDDARQFDDAQKDAAANQAVAGILGPNQGSFPTPDTQAIDMLRSGQGSAAQFDAAYGPGRAAQILQFNAQPRAARAPGAVVGPHSSPQQGVRGGVTVPLPGPRALAVPATSKAPAGAANGPTAEPQNDVLPGTPPSTNGGDGWGGSGVGM